MTHPYNSSLNHTHSELPTSDQDHSSMLYSEAQHHLLTAPIMPLDDFDEKEVDPDICSDGSAIFSFSSDQAVKFGCVGRQVSYSELPEAYQGRETATSESPYSQTQAQAQRQIHTEFHSSTRFHSHDDSKQQVSQQYHHHTLSTDPGMCSSISTNTGSSAVEPTVEPTVLKMAISASSSSAAHSSSSSNQNQAAVDTSDFGEWDVPLGRCQEVREFVGNVRFRSLVEHHRTAYLQASRKSEKTAIVTDLYHSISSHGGRFLDRKRGANEWFEISKVKATAKISQSLRNGTRPVRKALPPSTASLDKDSKKKAQPADSKQQDSFLDNLSGMSIVIPAEWQDSSFEATNFSSGSNASAPEAATASAAPSIATTDTRVDEIMLTWFESL